MLPKKPRKAIEGHEFKSVISIFYIGCFVLILCMITMTASVTFVSKANPEYSDFSAEFIFLLLSTVCFLGFLRTKYTFEVDGLKIDYGFQTIIIPYSSIQKIYQRKINPFFKKYNRKDRRKCGSGLNMMVILYLHDQQTMEMMISPKEEALFQELLFNRTEKRVEAWWHICA